MRGGHGRSAEPYRLIDADGAVVAPVASFLRELLAASRAPLTLRSYAMDLLRWWRFLAAVDIRWEQATPVEGRDFSLWIRQAPKPRSGPGPGGGAVAGAGAGGADGRGGPSPAGRAGWRPSRPGHPRRASRRRAGGMRRGQSTTARRCCGRSTTFTGKQAAGRWSTRSRWTGRGAAGVACASQPDGPVAAGAGRTVPARWRTGRRGGSRMRCSARSSRRCPRTGTGRWWRSGSRPGRGPRTARRLPRACRPGQQLITVVRKGRGRCSSCPPRRTRSCWLRLYQQQMRGQIPAGRRQPLWWTLRQPLAADLSRSAPDVRAGERAVGANWTLHELRHSAAYRMAGDPRCR